MPTPTLPVDPVRAEEPKKKKKEEEEEPTGEKGKGKANGTANEGEKEEELVSLNGGCSTLKTYEEMYSRKKIYSLEMS